MTKIRFDRRHANWLRPDADEDVEKEWVPYEGPRGGTGWQNTDTDEIVYEDEPPEEDDGGGDVLDEIMDDFESLTDDDEETGGWVDAPDDFAELDRGQAVSVWDDDEWESYEGVILEASPEGIMVGLDDLGVRRIDADDDLDPDANLYLSDVWDPDYTEDEDEDDEDEGRRRMTEEERQEWINDRVSQLPDVAPLDEGEKQGVVLDDGDIMGPKAEEEDKETLANALANPEFKGIDTELSKPTDLGPWTTEGNFMDPTEPKAVVEFDVDDWVNIQWQMLHDQNGLSRDEFLAGADPDDVDDYAETLREVEGDFTMPYMLLNQHGETVNHQEGRHRGLAAKEAGFETIPVLVMLDPDRVTKAGGNCPVPPPNPPRPKRLVAKYGNNWVPYHGPEGGEGWYNTLTDEIRYDDDPPGGVSQEYSEDYWENRSSPPDENIVGMADEYLTDVRTREYTLQEPTADFMADALESGYDPNEVAETAEWYLKQLEKEIGDGVLEEDTVNKVIREASTELVNRASTTEVDGYDAEVTLGDVNSDFRREWWEDFEEQVGYTDDMLTHEKPAYQGIRNWSMTSRMYSQSTAPLIKAAISETGNDFIPVNEEEVRETDVSEEEIGDILQYKEAVEDFYRETYGDTVPVFRGIDGDSSQLDGLKEDIEAGNPVELPEACLSSWATDPGTALEFAGEADRYDEKGVVLRKEVPIEQIFVSADTHPSLLSNENELVLAAPERYTEYDPDQVVEPDETTPLEQAVWAIESLAEDEEVERDPEPVVASKADVSRYDVGIEDYDWFRRVVGSRADETAEKEWQPYTGPQGGEGWKNPQTGEVRYTDEKPDSDDSSGSETDSDETDEGDDGLHYEFETTRDPEDVRPPDVTWEDALNWTEFDRLGEVPPGATVEFDAVDHPDITTDDSGTLEGEVTGYWEGDAEIGEPNGLEVEVEDYGSVIVFPDEFIAVETDEGRETSGQLLERPFERAQRVIDARDAGITGGNTTGDEMKICEMPNGKRVFATPSKAYEVPGTGVVSGIREARTNNLESPKVIDHLGGNACKTDIATDEDGREYIVKEGIEGQLLKETTIFGDSGIDYTADENEELRESLIETYAAAFFVGNLDLHGGNVIVNEDTQEATIIDHDSAGPSARGGWPSLNKFSEKVSRNTNFDPKSEIRAEAYRIAEDYMLGELELPDGVSNKYEGYMRQAVERLQKHAHFWYDYDGDMKRPPDGYSDLEDFEAGMTVRVVHPDTRRLHEAELTDFYEGTWYGATEDNYEVQIDDPADVIEVIDE